MWKKVLNKIKYITYKYQEKKRAEKRFKKLNSLPDKPKRGTADWLAQTEIEMGGYISSVKINKTSANDTRSTDQILRGEMIGMTGGDRMIHHDYSHIYESYLEPFVQKSENIGLIECGILRGTGLAVWSKLFPAATIVGLDIDLSHTQNNMEYLISRGAFSESKPFLIEFDQFKPDITELVNKVGQLKFSIVIDDGFHSDETIMDTFEVLYPLLNENFVYFAEDNSTVYRKLKVKYPKLTVRNYGQMTVVTP